MLIARDEVTGTNCSGIRFTYHVDGLVDFLHRETDLVSTLVNALVDFHGG